MKLLNYDIVFKEHPLHISLCLSISQCKFRCKNCHTPELQSDVGIKLSDSNFQTLLIKYQEYISNVIFMGGYEPNDYKEIIKFLNICHTYNLKTTLWTGYDEVILEVLKYLDYLKTGRYIEEKGPLGSKNTNQKYIEVKTNKEIKINGNQ